MKLEGLHWFFWQLSRIVLFVFSRVTALPFANRRPVPDPINQSQDIWASVIANVAPLMALVGERNVKEYMRTVANWHQLVPICCAPLGILGISVSAIRLSGPIFLRRLVGRDCERRSDALVEVTPLSVRPATSVYTRRAIEIESVYNKDAVAFVCGHVPEMDCNSAATGFRNLLRNHKRLFQVDKDMETVLAIWAPLKPLDEVGKLVEFVSEIDGEGDVDLPVDYPTDGTATASLSYRSTGISPTQRESSVLSTSLEGIRNILASLVALGAIIGVQFLGNLYSDTDSGHTALAMGCAGYLAIVIFSFALLRMIQNEIAPEKHVLPSDFSRAVWSFSNARHTEHQRTAPPAENTLVTARAREFTPQERLTRSIYVTILTGGLIGAFIVYYLAMRLLPWWTSLSSLAVTWTGALYRALASQATITATTDGIGHEEHWIGLFRATLDQSVLATISGACRRTLRGKLPAIDNPETTAPGLDKDAGSVTAVTELTPSAPTQYSATLIVQNPIRTSLGSWSGAEDVIKVGLELAKQACRERTISCEFHSFMGKQPSKAWLSIARVRLAIYVPGLVWRSHHYLDWALSPEFSFDDVCHYVVKILHVCIDQRGKVTRHGGISEKAATELSHVLCGPVAVPPMPDGFMYGEATLRQVLEGLRDNGPDGQKGSTERRFSVEQALLLPSAMIACLYDKFIPKRGSPSTGNHIQGLQVRHMDKLALSGAEWLPTMQREFERLGLWDHFTVKVEKKGNVDLSDDGGFELVPRDATSGNYSMYNARRDAEDSDGKDD